MLRSVKNLHFSPVFGLDGCIGKIDRFYFHEEVWSISYFVVTGEEKFSGKTVLLPANLYKSFDWKSHELFVVVRDEQITESPEIPYRLPEKKTSEEQLEREFGWDKEKMHIGKSSRRELRKKNQLRKNSGSLASTKSLLGFMLRTENKKIGVIDDMAVDETSWEIRFLISHPLEHVASKRMIVYPSWIKQISWSRNNIELLMTADELVTSYLL